MTRKLKREENYNRLLNVGLNLFNQKGYHGTGIKDIVDEAHLPKGSFYTYFDSKEVFAGSVVDYFTEQGLQMIEEAQLKVKNPLEGIRIFFKSYGEHLANSEFKGGCLLGNLSNELGAQTNQLTPHLVKGLQSMVNRISIHLGEAQKIGMVRKDLSADVLSDILVNAWEGALIRAQIQRDSEPINLFLDTYFKVFLLP